MHINFQNFKQNPNKPLFPLFTLSQVKSNVPVNIAAKFIQRENYWKRACEAKWPSVQIQIEQHGMSWKNAYLEKYI
jgi:hypothetical protein